MEIKIIEVNKQIRELLPETYKILTEANLTVHPYVYEVLLEGSRGPANCYRADSDIDLSLLVDTEMLHRAADEEGTLREIIGTTLNNWEGPVELDTAAVFDIHHCRLHCLTADFSLNSICPDKGADCLGIYKTQRGFNGYVPKFGVRIDRIHPLMTVWKRPFTSKF
jgi:hypothetical protein